MGLSGSFAVTEMFLSSNVRMPSGFQMLVAVLNQISYGAMKIGVQTLLSNSQAGPGRTVKQELEEISHNHIQVLFVAPFINVSHCRFQVSTTVGHPLSYHCLAHRRSFWQAFCTLSLFHVSSSSLTILIHCLRIARLIHLATRPARERENLPSYDFS